MNPVIAARFKNLTCFVTPKRKWFFFVSKASGPQEVFSNLDINTKVEDFQTFNSCLRLVSSGLLFLNFTWLTNWWRAFLHCFFILNISFNITVLLPRWTQARKLHVLSAEDNAVSAANKARGMLFYLKRSFAALTPSIFLPLYKPFIRPIPSYAVTQKRWKRCKSVLWSSWKGFALSRTKQPSYNFVYSPWLTGESVGTL